MTKFDEMRNALIDGNHKWSEYRDRSYRNLSLFVSGFIDYCGIPRDHVSFKPLNKEPEEKTNYAIFGATHLDLDGFWHLGVVIDMTHTEGFSFGINGVLFEICIKEKDGDLLVRAGKNGKVEVFDLQNAQLRNKYYDGLVEQANDKLANGLRNFLNGTAPRQVGFITA